MGIEQDGLDVIHYVPIIEENHTQETVLNAANEGKLIKLTRFVDI